MSSILEADTLLAFDVGNANTRVSLFDVVDGRYRLVATGRASSTARAPLFDVGEGVRMALDEIHDITGRRLIDEAETLIMPMTASGAGVDLCVATSSAGPKVRTVLVGLMPGVSVESAERLATSTYLDVVAEIGLLDKRQEDEQIDLILNAQPDLIVISGGTDGGATESVLNMVDTVNMAVHLIPDNLRPQVVFAGNRTLSADVRERFGDRFPITLVPNVRPRLDQEDLGPARLQLGEVIGEARSRRVVGFDELMEWTGGQLMLTADAIGRVVRYLSKVYDPDKGVLGIDLGASYTTIAAGFDGDLNLSVHSDLGLGTSMAGLLKGSDPDKVLRWLPIELSTTELRDYILNKTLNPETIPVTTRDLHIEYAIARQLIRSALFDARTRWPKGKDVESTLLVPLFEPILASGGVLSRAPRPGYAALTLLDAIQPIGITTLVLDPYSLMPALGAASAILPMVTVQVLESGSFISLGTVVSPVGRGRHGKPAVHVILEREATGEKLEGRVNFGQLVVLPLPQGEYGRLTLRPERGFDVGFGGSGRAGALRVAGGALGLIVDARGRPIELPSNPTTRREVNQKWLWDIGAVE